jgi:hypothetical protein
MSDTTPLPFQGEHGIKETVEAAVGAKLLLKAVNKSLEDGKLGFGDVGNFLQAQDGLLAGIEGANQIRVEAKDLQREEAVALAGYLYDLIDEILKLGNRPNE